jgi:hypothetical protein
MEVSGQFHTLTSLSPGKEPPPRTPWIGAGWVTEKVGALWKREITFALAGNQRPVRGVVTILTELSLLLLLSVPVRRLTVASQRSYVN